MSKIRYFLIFTCLISALTTAGEELKTPHKIIAALQQRMYAIGETSGSKTNFDGAEQNAVNEIKLYVENGDANGLIEKDKNGNTPLMVAAMMGYSNMVSELLKSTIVQKSINEKNPKGGSAWLYANMANRQAAWVCNPQVFQNIFALIPMLVTQEYYIKSTENPYKKIRNLLEKAGAGGDVKEAKEFWNKVCLHQGDSMRDKIDSSNDILETVLMEGKASLEKFMLAMKAKEKAERQKNSQDEIYKY
jgi:Ankyrin repeat